MRRQHQQAGIALRCAAEQAVNRSQPPPELTQVVLQLRDLAPLCGLAHARAHARAHALGPLGPAAAEQCQHVQVQVQSQLRLLVAAERQTLGCQLAHQGACEQLGSWTMQ